MNKIDLHKLPPLLVQIDFRIDGQYYDLHNDYECIDVSIRQSDLILTFAKCETQKKRLEMIFYDYEIENIASILMEKLPDGIDNLNRSYIEPAFDNGSYSFIFSFTNGGEYNIRCGKAVLEVL